jgi:threonine dehydrogenase-like Zn-dependent dehydrogenase
VASRPRRDRANGPNGRGVDLVLEATNSPEGLQIAAQSARIGGRVVLVGIPDGDQYAPLSASLLRRKGLDIRHVAAHGPRVRAGDCNWWPRARWMWIAW